MNGRWVVTVEYAVREGEHTVYKRIHFSYATEAEANAQRARLRAKWGEDAETWVEYVQ